MAKSKADLIEEAAARGIPLTGDEAAADLRKLLNDADPEDGENTPAQPTPEEVAVADAKAKLDEAQAHLEAAKAEHEAAKAAHADATKEPDPELGVHYQIEGNSTREVLPEEFKGIYPFRIRVNGQDYEHVSDHPVTGAWIYRQS